MTDNLLFINFFQFYKIMQRILLAVLAAGLSFSLIGCGDGNPGTVPLSITITHKGAPLSKATVTIISSDGKGHTAGGQTDSSGVAIMETPPKWKGALPGEYAVSVKKWEKFEYPEPSMPGMISFKHINALPEKYGEHSTSGFTLTVDKKATKATFDIAE